jgi:PAS domain S-box-containing protein
VSSLTKRGQRLDLELSAFAIKDTRGKVMGYVGIKRDITERRRAEASKTPPSK